MEDFENKLEHLSKPEIKNLKHEPMIWEYFIKMKRKSALSWWWVFFPAYLIAILVMKSFYFPGRSTFEYLKDFIGNYPYFSFLVLTLMPLLTIIINLLAVKKIWFYSASGRLGLNFLRIIFFPLLLIFTSILIIVIYIIMVL